MGEAAGIDEGHRAGLPEREELAQVRRENRALREERNSLKQETAFFGSENR